MEVFYLLNFDKKIFTIYLTGSHIRSGRGRRGHIFQHGFRGIPCFDTDYNDGGGHCDIRHFDPVFRQRCARFTLEIVKIAYLISW